MKKLLPLFLYLLLGYIVTEAQSPLAPIGKAAPEFNAFNDKFPPNTYANADNPYYWKNKLPRPGYWQQDIHYTIDANIDEVNDCITGDETLEYVNNSPDTLRFVFFHLYQNAFQPGSYLDDLNKANHFKNNWGPNESAGRCTKIDFIESLPGGVLQKEIDFSIMKVYLAAPLLPGAKTQFHIKFRTWFDNGGQRRRMKKFTTPGYGDEPGYRHYDGVHWYPRISVYDDKFGWDTQQHLGKEFYGDFGCYDVRLTFSSNYVVEATGWLQNEEEVLPKKYKDKLMITNFASKKWNEKASEIIPYQATDRKTWVYHAENVHDFAWTADPTYRIGEAWWDGIKIVAMCQESHAAGWQTAASFTAKVIEYYSNRIGRYAYPKMVVADAQDGMEYPMLTLDGGWEPNYHDVLAHEVAHNWFFGMVGNNETYRAFLDEGFTQFLNTNAGEALDGKFKMNENKLTWYEKKFRQPTEWRSSRTFLGYMNDAVKFDESTLNTHSDDFNGALGHGGGYRNVYFKTSTMLYNLQYVLGDSLFWQAFSHYFNQYKIAHPYPEDFRNSIINYTHVDLNWFFDQWMETSKTIDYKIKKVKMHNDENYQITLKRIGEMQMPIDLTVYAVDDSKKDFVIPNTWFAKNTTAQVLPKWYGWGKMNDTYTFNVNVPSGIDHVTIDPSNRLADRNMLNNRTGGKVDLRFDSQLNQPGDWTHYIMHWRPDVWWNRIDGVKLGGHLDGNYMNYKHVFSLTAWANTGFLNQRVSIPYASNRSLLLRNGRYFYSPPPMGTYYRNYDYYFDQFNGAFSQSIFNVINYNFDYKNAADEFLRGSSWQFHSQVLEGLSTNYLQYNIEASGNNSFSIQAKYMRLFNADYLPNKNNWGYSTILNQPHYGFTFDPILSYYNYNWANQAYYFPQPGVLFQTNISTTANWNHRYYYMNGNGLMHTDFRVGSSGSAIDGNFHAYSAIHHYTINNNRIDKFNLRTRFYFALGIGGLPQESSVNLSGANGEELADNKFTRSEGLFDFQNSVNHVGGMNSLFNMGGGLNLRSYAYDGFEVANNFYSQNNISRGRGGVAINAELEFSDYINVKPSYRIGWLKTECYLFADAGSMQYDLGSNRSSMNIFYNTALSPLLFDTGIGFAFTIKKWGALETIKPLTLRIDWTLYRQAGSHVIDKMINKDMPSAFPLLLGINRAF